MGLYYNPPMPNMGGQQPPAHAPGIPQSGPAPQNPPFVGGAKVPQQVLDAWIPPAPSAIFDEATITFPLGAPNPPPDRFYKIEKVITAWIPPAPGFETSPPKSQSGVASSNPPIREIWSAHEELTRAWMPPDPGPYQGNAQQYAQEVMTPPISGPVGQNPPFAGSKVGIEVLNSWIPPDPMWQGPILLDPPQSADRAIVGVHVPDGVIQAWNVPPPQPITAIKTTYGVGVPPAVSPTDQLVRSWYVAVDLPLLPIYNRLPSSSDIRFSRAAPDLQAWAIPPAPIKLVLSTPPSVAPPAGPPPIGASVPQALGWSTVDPAPQWTGDIVPFIGPEPPHRARTMVPVEVLTSWLPAAPMPITARLLASPASADSSSGNPVRLPVILLAWNPPELRQAFQKLTTPPSVGGVLAKPGIPDPIMQQWSAVPVPVPAAQPARTVRLSADQPVIGASVPSGALTSWLPADPLPILTRNPPQSGPIPSSAPLFRGNAEIIVAWLPARPEPYLQEQPYAPEVTVPPISGPSPQNPPFAGGAAAPQAVLLSWLSSPPDQKLAKIPPPTTSAAANPPVIGSKVPPAVLISWRLPEPLPAIVMSPPQFAAAPSAPPPIKGEGHVLADLWTPGPPMPMDVTAPGYPLISADPAPFGNKMPSAAVDAWMPAPQPIVRPAPVISSSDRPPPLRPLQPIPEPTVTIVKGGPQPLTAPQPRPSLPFPVVSAWVAADPGQQDGPNLVQAQPANVVPVPMPVAIWNSWLLPDLAQQQKKVILSLVAPTISAPPPRSNQLFWSIYAGWYPPEPLEQSQLYGARVVSLLQPSFVLNPNLIATAQPRRMVATVVSNNIMARTNDLGPAIDASVEQETSVFDFGLVLNAGVIISNVVSLTCLVYKGKDDSASARLIGGSFVGPSPRTMANSAAVYQLIGNMVGGVTYRLQCVVKTSDGQTLSAWTHLYCQIPN